MAKARSTKRKVKEPQVGSEEWYAEQQAKPGFALGVMKDLSNDIAQGSKTAIKSLERWIAKYPDVARSIHKLDDLCSTAEAAWVKALAGDDPLRQLGLKDEIAAMKAELLGDNPSILDRVMASSVVTAHMAHQGAVWAAAQPAQHHSVATARGKRVESTARRLLLAVKVLAVVRQQAGRGLAPKTKGKLFDTTA